jgi:hypothetical protein
VPQLELTTSVHNSRAHRGFAKAGFVITRQYQPPGLELCHLMIRDIAAERGTSTIERTPTRTRPRSFYNAARKKIAIRIIMLRDRAIRSLLPKARTGVSAERPALQAYP